MLFETHNRPGINPPNRMPPPRPKTTGNFINPQTARKAAAAAMQNIKQPHIGKTITGWPSQQKGKILAPHIGKPFIKKANAPKFSNRTFFPGKGLQYKTSRPVHKNSYLVRNVSAPVFNPKRNRAFDYEPLTPNPYIIPNPQPIPGLRPNPYGTPDDQPCNCGGNNGCATLSHFAVGSAEPTAAHKQQINILAKSIISRKIKFVTITGHTDVTGSDENNMVLGYKRGMSIRAETMNAVHRLKNWAQSDVFWKVITKGEREPVSTTDAGLNRRAEVCLQQNVCS